MYYPAVSARSENEIPGWAKHYHDWETTTDVSKLKKLKVKMRLCCNSCEEKIGDDIRGMPGVFDFQTDKRNDLLTIYESPGEGPSHKKLLKKLKKVDKQAQIVNNSKECEEEEENKIVYYVPMPPGMMMPWNPGMSMLPPFVNYNYLQPRGSCGHCLGYPAALCSSCG